MTRRHRHILRMNLFSRLLSDPTLVRLETWSLEPVPTTITLTLTSRSRSARCPLRRRRARRTHSWDRRTLADLPWGEHTVVVRLHARRLFRCPRARWTWPPKGGHLLGAAGVRTAPLPNASNAIAKNSGTRQKIDVVCFAARITQPAYRRSRFTVVGTPDILMVSLIAYMIHAAPPT